MFRDLLAENDITVPEYMEWKKLYYGSKPKDEDKKYYEKILFKLIDMYQEARAKKQFIKELEKIFSRDELKKIKYSTENQKVMNKKNAKESISC